MKLFKLKVRLHQKCIVIKINNGITYVVWYKVIYVIIVFPLNIFKKRIAFHNSNNHTYIFLFRLDVAKIARSFQNNAGYKMLSLHVATLHSNRSIFSLEADCHRSNLVISICLADRHSNALHQAIDARKWHFFFLQMFKFDFW